jgi:hypothetical protein
MFRRISTTSYKAHREQGVKFCDGYGVTTRAERSNRRLDAARTSTAVQLPRV